MRLNRFFGNFDLNGKVAGTSDKELINQLRNVLRLKVGEEIILCDGKLNEAECSIESLDKNEATFKILKTEKNKKELEWEIVLYCSILKKENFELAVQKAVELGVKRIIPVIASRTVKLGLKRDRLDKIIKEAAEQSGRGILPILSDYVGFNDAVSDALLNDLNIFFDLGGVSLGQIKDDISKCKNIGIFIGPEGGWDESEIGLAIKNRFKIASLSPFTLRAETAVIAGLAAVIRSHAL
ncbi:MAG: 16S rRNA (uracil(1498)-N(3))-methyltransferase [Patescibacteria group bacterium]|nr:16S rRNA (uracil(1498)-N(3))-methyltransferase [Patescibacteria group bacterium]